MMKEVKQVLEEFVKECSGKLDLYGILQFGSSTYDENAHDVDLILCSNEKVFSKKDIINLIRIIKNFEKENKEVVFDFGGVLSREKKAKYSITSVFIGLGELSLRSNPQDIFFFKNLSEDKDVKILFGKNPFLKRKFIMKKNHMFEMICIEEKHSLRKSLDKTETKLESSYSLFKTILRVMLINEKGILRKNELIKSFIEIYKNNIPLPKNSKDILNHVLREKDFENILEFAEDCLRYLSK